MSILLFILKLFGIIILCILGLFLLSVLLVLFYPLKYKINASYKEKAYFRFDFSWLIHFVRGFLLYDDGKLEWSFSILFWKLFPKKEKKEKKPKKIRQSKKSVEEKKIHDFKEDSNVSESLPDEKLSEVKSENTEAILETTDIAKENKKLKKENPLKKVFKIFVHIKYSLLKICDKIKDIINNISSYIDFIYDDNTRLVLEKVKVLLIKTYISIKPKKIRGMIHIGFKDSPDLEGKLLMVHGLLYPVHKGKLEIIPDFETDTKEADIFIKGSLNARLVISYIRFIFFDKDVTELKRRFEEK